MLSIQQSESVVTLLSDNIILESSYSSVGLLVVQSQEIPDSILVNFKLNALIQIWILHDCATKRQITKRRITKRRKFRTLNYKNADFKTSEVTKGRITKRRITKRQKLQKVEKQKIESN